MKSRDQLDSELWNRLLAHRGHTLAVATYGESPDDPANVSLECEDCGEVVLDAELYTICARGGEGQQNLRVETPLGVLFASVQGDPDHPGIQIGLHSQTANQDLLLTLVEFCKDEGDLPDGKHCIITRVWDEAMQDEYAYRHIHKGIEDFFKSEDAPEPTKEVRK